MSSKGPKTSAEPPLAVSSRPPSKLPAPGADRDPSKREPSKLPLLLGACADRGASKREPSRPPPPARPAPVPFEVDGSTPSEARATFQVPRGAARRLAARPVAAKGGYFELLAAEPPAHDAEEGGGEGGAGSLSQDAVLATFYSPKPEDTALAIAQILGARLLEWASLLFTPDSEAALATAEPLGVAFQSGRSRNPTSLMVWIGDGSEEEQTTVREWIPPAGLKVVGLSWSQHAVAESLSELDMQTDGSWYAKQPTDFANADFNLLQDMELVARSMVEAISRKLSENKLDWDALVLAGFGKGAGIALHALVTKLLPKPIAGTILFSPTVVFPNLWRLGKKNQGLKEQTKLFTFWGISNPSTPDCYCNALTQKLESIQELQYTPETIPHGGHVFDTMSTAGLTKVLPLCIPGVVRSA